MNTPGVAAGNWSWRCGPAGLFSTLDKEAAALRAMAHRYNRLQRGAPEIAAPMPGASAAPPAVSAAAAKKTLASD